MLNILSFASKIEELEKQLNNLASQLDNPFAGMVIFMVLMVIAFMAIKSYTSR